MVATGGEGGERASQPAGQNTLLTVAGKQAYNGVRKTREGGGQGKNLFPLSW